MVTSGLLLFFLQWKTVVRAFSTLTTFFTRKHSADDPMERIEVPGSWFLGGMLVLGAAAVYLGHAIFNITWWMGAIAVLLTFFLVMVAGRATGETDITPTGPLSKITQLSFGAIKPGDISTNLMTANITAGACSHAGDLLTDLKSGYLLGANPRKQFLAQFIGIFFGTLAIVPAWYLMIPNVEALEKFPLPATRTWEAVARVLSQGLEALPMSARWAAFAGALIGILLPVIEHLAPKARRWMPSAMGIGLGWVVFFSNALAFTIGAAIAWAWSLLDRRTQDTYNIPIASGLVAGESMVKAFIAMAATALGLLGLGG